MMSEFELTPLQDEDHEVVLYGSKVNNTGSYESQLLKQDGSRKRNDLRFISTRIVMKRKQKFCRIILMCLVVLLVLMICLLLGFYLNETKKRKSENLYFETTQVDVKPILTKGAVYVKSFSSFIGENDNRIFETVFSNGTSLKLFGTKGFNSDSFKIDSLYVSHSKHDQIRIRFGTHNNIAYVLLGHTAQVNYEWSRDLTSIDLKVYLSSALKGLDANSFVFTVKLMELAPLLQVIFKTLGGKSYEYHFPLTLKKRKCGQYLPLRVTKCGSKNIYDGAFLEGKISVGKDRLIIPALPWPPLQDDCFKQQGDTSSTYNFYIPLTGHSTAEESTCNKATKYFMKICSVIPKGLPSNQICYNISQQINHVGERHFDQLVNIVYESCLNILSSIVLMCSSLQTEFEPYNDPHSPYFVISERIMRKKLCTDSKISKKTRKISLTLSVLAFCPTEAPIMSSDQIVYFNQSTASTIHINCRGPPEITLYQLAHAYIGNDAHLTTLQHNFRICAKCAFETVVTVRVLDNEVCCQNICLNDNTSVCALGRLEVKEKFQFTSHGSLYCHNFLDDVISDTSSLNVLCAGKCVNHFTIDFKVSNFRGQEIFYHQPIMCRGSSSQTCNAKFGT